MFPLLHTNPKIWAFEQQTTKEIESINLETCNDTNLSKAQKQVIKSLQNNTDIIIKPADKGGNLVIMNTAQYETMYNDILLNKTWHRPISKTVIENFCKEYRSIILKAYQQGIIDQNTWNFLNTKVPTFYALPKVHKSITQPPGHPIISGCASLTEKKKKKR